MEFVFLAIPLLKYNTVNHFYYLFAPSWIFCLYFLFGLTLNHALSFLNKKKWFAFFGGLFGGFLSYYAGYRLGAVNFDSLFFLIFISLSWGIFLTIVIGINRSLGKIVHKVFNPFYLEKTIEVYFDTKCLICFKEFQYLRKRKQTGKVVYIPFQSLEDLKIHTNKFSYQDAMKQIHAIDSNKKIIKGVEVFSELYSRTDLQWLALILMAPVMHSLCRLGYWFWAKYRLYRLKKR